MRLSYGRQPLRAALEALDPASVRYFGAPVPRALIFDNWRCFHHQHMRER